MSDSILIIGATGSVGYEVAKRLNELDQRTKVAVRNPEKAKSTNLDNVDFTYFDYLKPETFDVTFAGIKKVLLVSPPSYLKLQENVKKAIDSSISQGTKLIVNVSAISIESDLDKPMKEIEDHIKDSGVDYVFLRPNCYMQNFKDLFRDLIIEENQISVPVENEKSCFVDVRDVADVAVKALTDDNLRNSTYILTGNQSLNMHVVAHLFSEALNKDIEFINITDEMFEKQLRHAGWPEGSIQGTAELCSHVKSGKTAQKSEDIQKILDREPIKFEQFIKDFADNWK